MSSPADAIKQLEESIHDNRDPSPWVALYLDTSVPINEKAKASILVDVSSRSRQFLFPLIRPFCRLAICILKVLKTIIPNAFTSSWILHQSIYLGLRGFVSPHANFMIVRHFNIGSEILEFIAKNTQSVEMKLHPLRPKNLADLKDDVFLQHDLNIYNFIIEINRQLKEKNLEFTAREELDFSCISDHGEFEMEEMPNGFFNKIDLESAIEIYTPMYQMLLTDSDFWRACNSLQLDETIALYATRLIGDSQFLGLVNNRHPIIPESTLGAAHRLMLHGLAAESLHAYLVTQKRKHQAGKPASASEA